MNNAARHKKSDAYAGLETVRLDALAAGGDKLIQASDSAILLFYYDLTGLHPDTSVTIACMLAFMTMPNPTRFPASASMTSGAFVNLSNLNLPTNPNSIHAITACV